MSFFAQFQSSRLYVAEAGAGWLAYLMPDGATLPDGIDTGPALSSLKGSFLFAPTAPSLGDQGALATFIAAVDAFTGPSVTGRGILWITDPDIVAATTPMIGLSGDGSQTIGQMTAPVIPSTLSFNLPGGAAVSVADDILTFAANGVVFFAGPRAPGPTQASQVPTATMPLSGPRRGCLVYDIFLQRSGLFGNFAWGFHFLAPSDDPVYTRVGFWAPLASGSDPDGGDMLGFAASFDPSDPLNLIANTGAGERPVRSVLVFTGQNDDGSQTVLTSGFATTTGAVVTLVPVGGPVDNVPDAARLVFNDGEREQSDIDNFQAVPDGQFVMALPGAAAGATAQLLCGLHGTEYAVFRPLVAGSYAGDRLSFTSRAPSYAATYPFVPSSPVGPPVDPTAPLLGNAYTTAWATLVPGEAGGTFAYVAQPKGAPLYGRDTLVHQGDATLLGSVDPAVQFPAGTIVPMAPYGLVTPANGQTGFTAATIEDFEARVIGPVRRAIIAGAATPRLPAGNGGGGGGAGAAGDDDGTATTPAGLLVSLDDDGQWTKILLGQNLSPTLAQMCFCQPGPDLVDAFSTGQLFLVVANATKLGPLQGQGPGDCSGGPGFWNGINVGDWRFAAGIGQNNHYGDYADVMIVKGRKGPLWDPDDPSGSLIVNPEQWTMNQAFAAPSDVQSDGTVGPPNPDELVALAYWLKSYFEAAAAQTDSDYFGNFNTIARKAEWTGILFLRMTIAKLPDNLIGIRAGVTAPAQFNAHHLGIEISPVTNPAGGPIALSHSSSMFGLIYYVDPAFTPPDAGAQPQPVAPTGDDPYGFRLLSLKALFQNTAVQRFQSFAQLRLANLFGMDVDHMGDGGNPYATLVVSGSYQDNGGKAVYGLSTTTTSSFFYPNNLFNKIEVDTAQMSTRDTGATSGTVTSWFALGGFLDFSIVQSKDGDFDILSFGSPAGAPETPRQGLSFSNLGLQMSFPVPPPGAPVAGISFGFVTDQIGFDVATSTPRPGSLYSDFALGLQGLVAGDADNPPAALGFLPVIGDAVLNDPSGGAYYGLSYQLDLGTPGALAGDLGLKASLLTAWAPDSSGTDSYAGLIGIKLPGAGSGGKLISLQNVLKLSIGQVRLTRAETSSGAKSFLLMLTEIALKFLGMLKIPPSGSTLFYLFGNPSDAGKPSGLGWYASYRKAQKQQAALPPPQPAETGEEVGS